MVANLKLLSINQSKWRLFSSPFKTKPQLICLYTLTKSYTRCFLLKSSHNFLSGWSNKQSTSNKWNNKKRLKNNRYVIFQFYVGVSISKVKIFLGSDLLQEIYAKLLSKRLRWFLRVNEWENGCSSDSKWMKIKKYTCCGRCKTDRSWWTSVQKILYQWSSYSVRLLIPISFLLPSLRAKKNF